MAGGIFISYRRSDSAAFSGRLADFFEVNFPDVRVFYDMVAIEPGEDFVEAINRRIASSEVVLAMIGEDWLEATDGHGQRRLDNPEDFVRLELASALSTDTRVIPVLIDRAMMPTDDDLPAPLKGLARCNAQFIRGEAFKRDAEFLGSFILDFLTQSDKIMQVAPQAPQRQADSEIKSALKSALEDFKATAPSDAFITVSNEEDKCVQVAKASDDDSICYFNFPPGDIAPERMDIARQLLSEAVDSSDAVMDEGDYIMLEVAFDPAFLTRLTLDVFENVYGGLPDRPFEIVVEA